MKSMLPIAAPHRRAASLALSAMREPCKPRRRRGSGLRLGPPRAAANGAAPRRRRSPTPSASAGAPAARRPPPRRGRAPSNLRSFADVSRDAKEMPGPVPALAAGGARLHRDRAGAVRPAVLLLDQPRPGPRREPLPRRAHDEQPDAPLRRPADREFRKVGSSVQLVASNAKYTAQAGTPEARAVADAFSDSLLATAPVVSQPHPERKSVLVDANALFFADLPGAAPRLEVAYRQSVCVRCAQLVVPRGRRATPDFASFDVTAHYALARVSLPQAGGAFAGRAAVDAARHPQPVPRLPLHARQAARHADAAARGRCAHRLLHAPSVFDFTTDDRRTADRALRQPLAPREEGPDGRAVRAEAADRLLDRPQHPACSTARRSAKACSSGTRRSSASATRTRSASRSSPTTPTSTPPTSATPRSAG